MSNTALAPITAQPVSQEQAGAWVGMAQAKNNLVADLTRAELAAQGILHNVPLNSHEAIDTSLAAYRKAHSDMVEVRKGFTQQIQAGIIEPLMAFEKRVDPKGNELYRQLEAASLGLRKAAAEEAAKVNSINQEKASFTAHCVNEFSRIAAQYRSDLGQEIHNQYRYWLEQRISPEIDKIKEHLTKIPIPQVAKFSPRYITPADMEAAYATIRRPDFQQIFNDMLVMLDTTFQTFDSDLANAAAAIAAHEDARKLEEAEASKKLAEEAAINTLIIQAETVEVEAPKVKVTVQVLIVESEAWAKAVMAGFIVNMPRLAKYIRVKSWAKLTIGQMAEYLGKLATDEGIEAPGLTYNEVEK